MFNMYLGHGNTLLDMIKGANLKVTRVVPITQGFIPDFSDYKSNNLLGATGESNEATNVQPYFASWDLDLWGTGNSWPITMWQELYGPLSIDLSDT